MVNQRFFKTAGPFTLKKLSVIAEAELVRGDADAVYEGVSSLQEAEKIHVAALHNPKYRHFLGETNAGVCIVKKIWVNLVPQPAAVLVSENPYRAFSKVAQAFYPQEALSASSRHPSAWVDETASLGEGCVVAQGAVIEAGAVLGARCYIGANSVVGAGVVMGEGCVLHANVTLTHALLGDGVLIKPGARIGQQGFGFFMEDPEAMCSHVSVPQLGLVRIGQGVEIGANTTIDRGSLQDTVIEDWVRIDNLVQIAHNVHLGKGCVLVAQVGIAGSTRVGDFSVLGGQVGLAGHLKIAPGTQVAAKSGVVRDTAPGEVLAGIPAVPIQEWRRQSIRLNKLGKKDSGK
jgi:UDP-3-O-[3-hydroxymyristoyl] glucosamine N-acyltransferase